MASSPIRNLLSTLKLPTPKLQGSTSGMRSLQSKVVTSRSGVGSKLAPKVKTVLRQQEEEEA